MEDFTETYGGELRTGARRALNVGVSRDYDIKDVTDTNPHVNQGKLDKMTIQMHHSFKILARTTTVALVVLMLLLVIININTIIESIYTIKNGGKKSNFTQYLGGTANQIRGDRDDKSLAEMALLAAAQAATPQTFVSRERLTTPEEEMMQQIKKKV